MLYAADTLVSKIDRVPGAYEFYYLVIDKWKIRRIQRKTGIEILEQNEGGHEVPEHTMLFKCSISPSKQSTTLTFSEAQGHALKFSNRTIG